MSTNSNGKIRGGIVGVGNWGRYGRIPVLQLLPNFEIVAVASRRKEYAVEIAQKFSIPHGSVATLQVARDRLAGCSFWPLPVAVYSSGGNLNRK